MTQTDEVTPQYRILPNNGAGWYWEVVSQDREVIARGVAATHIQARADAMIACSDQRPQEFFEWKLA